MFKHIVIAIVIIIPAVQSTNITFLQHLVWPIPVCIRSEICNHTWVPVCGMDRMLLDTRFFTDECDMYEYNCDHKTGYTTVDIEKCSNTTATEMTAVTPENATTKSILRTVVTEATMNQPQSNQSTTMKIETTIPETTLQKTTIIKTTIPDLRTTMPTDPTINKTKIAQPREAQNVTTITISLKVTLTEATLPLTTMTSTTQIPVLTVLSTQSKFSRNPEMNSTSESVTQSTEPVTTIPLNKVTELSVPDITISVKTISVTAVPKVTSTDITMPKNTTTTEKKNKIVVITESSSPTNINNTVTTKTKTNSTKYNGGCTCSHTHPFTPTRNNTTSATVTTTPITVTTVATTVTPIPTAIKTTPTTKIAEITTKTDSTSKAGGCTCTTSITASHTTASHTTASHTTASHTTIAITLTDTATSITTAPNNKKSENTISETTVVTHNKMQDSSSIVGACTCTPSTDATFNTTPSTSITLPGTPITKETSLSENNEIITTPSPTTLKTTKTCKSTYPKHCEMPVSWETTVKGERRDFFQILRDLYTKNERGILRRTFFTPLSGVLISRKNDKSSFMFGSHVESLSSFDNKMA